MKNFSIYKAYTNLFAMNFWGGWFALLTILTIYFPLSFRNDNILCSISFWWKSLNSFLSEIKSLNLTFFHLAFLLPFNCIIGIGTHEAKHHYSNSSNALKIQTHRSAFPWTVLSYPFGACRIKCMWLLEQMHLLPPIFLLPCG